MARKFLALTAIIVPLGLVACGGSDSSSSTSASSDTTATESSTGSSTTASGGGGGGETVTVGETEYKLDPSTDTVKAGSVTLDAQNNGSTVHNLVIEGNGIAEQSTDDLQPGDSGQLTVDLPAGTYEIYCSIDGHQDLGMDGEITVQ